MDFLTAALWPAVAVGLAIHFRSQVVLLLGRLKSGSVGNASFELESASRFVEELGPEHTVSAEIVDDESLPADEVPPSAELDTVVMSRTEFQELVEVFARAGWKTGASGEYSEPPIPSVEWAMDGTPVIASWTPSRGASEARRRDLAAKSREWWLTNHGQSARQDSAHAADALRLEKKVFQIERTLSDPKVALHSSDRRVLEAELDTARNRLRALKPDSVWR